MWSLLVAVLLGAQPSLAAPIPVALPPGEDPTAWVEPLALADLVPGAPTTGPRVVIEAAGPKWRLVVRDAAGALHVVEVAPPVTPADREATAHLAASLARPVLSLPLPPAPVAARPRPAPAPVVAAPEVLPPETRPTAPVVAPAPAPAKVAPPRVVPDPEVPEETASVAERPVAAPDPWTSEAWARGSAGLAWRDRGGAVSGTALGGWAVGPARLGAGVAASGPYQVAGTNLGWTSLDGLGGVWFAMPDGPMLGVLGGISWRRYGDVLAVTRALAGVELGWRASLSPRVDLLPAARVDLDPGLGGLRRTTVTVDGETVLELAPLALKLELGVALHGAVR